MLKDVSSDSFFDIFAPDPFDEFPGNDTNVLSQTKTGEKETDKHMWDMIDYEKECRLHDKACRDKGRALERNAIAKRMKLTGFFTDDFIAQITGAEIKSVRRMKMPDEQ